MANTKVMCGGIYEGEMHGKVVRAVMTSTVNEGEKDASGLLQLKGYAAEHVVEGSERLNQFKLVAKAAPLTPSTRKTSSSK